MRSTVSVPIRAAAILFAAATLAASCSLDSKPGASDDPADLSGTLPDGATWRILAPKQWNGTLLLYSHGLVAPGDENPASTSPDQLTAAALIGQGYALAGTSYSATGWAVEEALDDQLAMLDVFADEVGTPEQTVAWGNSLGGLVTLGLLERAPDRFDGGVAMCGPVAGTNAVWDSYLDVLFVLRTLLAPTEPIELAAFEDNPLESVASLSDAMATAAATAHGRARIALASAVGAVPDELVNLETLVLYGIALRADLEVRAGGNPSTNAVVDYAALLASSAVKAEVEALYATAGVDLGTDLAVLAAAPRITADPAARAAAAAAFTPSGALADPVLTLHTTADGLAIYPHEGALAERVAAAGAGELLRQAATERAGHCTFTPAETVAAMDALLERVATGAWPDTSTAALTARATALDPKFHVLTDPGIGAVVPTAPSFTDAPPGPYPGLGRP